MWVAVKTMNEDDVDKPPADGGIDLGEAETTDLWSGRGCLEKISTSWEFQYLADGKRELTIIAIQTMTLRSDAANRTRDAYIRGTEGRF